MVEEIKKFITKISQVRGTPEEELKKIYLLLWIEKEQSSQDLFFKSHIRPEIQPYTRIKQDVVIHYGEMKNDRYMVVFSFHLGMVRPKCNKDYYSDVDDWEWVNDSIPRLMTDFLNNPNYHLVVVSDEIISWKIQMIMNVVNIILPPYGNASIYVNVNQRLPSTNYYPKHTWSNALMVGTTEVDQQFASDLAIDFFTPDMLTYP